MKKLFLNILNFKLILAALFITVFFSPVFAVEQQYMPYGYVRDDVITPHYLKLTNIYFNKVDSNKIDCNWKTYRKEVQTPLSKITEEFFKNSKKEF